MSDVFGGYMLIFWIFFGIILLLIIGLIICRCCMVYNTRANPANAIPPDALGVDQGPVGMGVGIGYGVSSYNTMGIGGMGMGGMGMGGMGMGGMGYGASMQTGMYV